MDEFSLLFKNSKIDIICATETWFFANVDSNVFNLKGYRLFRSDRIINGGGVAVYIRTDSKNDGGNIECILLEICNNDEKLLLGTIYRPNRHIFMELMFEMLSSHILGYDHIILIDDFNENILEDNSLLENMSTIGFSLVNGRNSTHFTSTSSASLDLCFINEISASMFSRNDILFISYDYRIKKSQKTQKLEYRLFKNIDYNSIAVDL